MSNTDTVASKPGTARPHVWRRSETSAVSGGPHGTAAGPTAQVHALYDPWGRSLLHAIRRFWLLPLALALAGAAAGGYVGTVAQPSAEALVRVQSSSSDGQALTFAVATAAQQLDTAQNFATAAKATGGSGAELRNRTQIAPVADSQVLSITVTAPTLDQAVAEANAVVDSGIAEGNARRDAELAEVTTQTRDLISKSKLSDPDAEKARVSSLGDALATNQSSLIDDAQQLTKLSPAASAGTVPSAGLLGGMGLVGGGLAGLAVALVVGGRRGKVKSAKELRRLYPHVPVLDQDELDSLVDMEAATTSTWVVGSLGQSVDRLQPVIDQLSDQLSGAGVDVRISTSLSGLRNRTHTPGAAVTDVTVVATALNQAVVRNTERDAEASLLLVVQPLHTRHEWLDEYAATFGDHTYIVVARQPSSWKW